MHFKYNSLSTNVTANSVPTDKTHNLSFVANDATSVPTMGYLGQSNIVLQLTAEEASAYELGKVYALQLTEV